MLVPLVDQYIYIDTKDSYLRISDKQILTPKALNTVHIQQYPGGEIPKACVVFDTDPARRVCSGLGWMPVPDSIIELGGVKYANTFTGFAVEPVAGDVSEWLALCEHIYGEHVDLVLDHMAFTVQFPMKKIRWQILVLGKPRTCS